jgi:hypothetical protein
VIAVIILLIFCKGDQEERTQDSDFSSSLNNCITDPVLPTTTELLHFFFWKNTRLDKDGPYLYHSDLSSCISLSLSQIQLLGTVLHIPPHRGEALQSQLGCYQIAKWQQSPSASFHLYGKSKKQNICIRLSH